MLQTAIIAWLVAAPTPNATITIHLDKPSTPISKTYYGLMTEEINHSYDGGLYAELVRNRNLKDSDKATPYWSLILPKGARGGLALDLKQGVPGTALDRSLRLEFDGKGVGVANEGYWGIPVKPNNRYRASLFAKAAGFSGSLTVSIQSLDGKVVYATARTAPLGPDWRKLNATLRTRNVKPTTKARLVVSANGKGDAWLTQVSLFPPTFHGRRNGVRIDLMEKLIAMKPKFLRFPGGNYVEGNSFAERFNWKETIGPVEDRPGHMSPWGYRSTDGLGLLEFLEWAEDMGAEPVLAVFAAYSLNRELVAEGPKLHGFVQDALDEIEYVTGDASTKWGALRAKDGHPKPFPLRYVEVGNEDWGGTQYKARFAAFFDAIRAKYPHLKIIATAPVRDRKPDLVDDHYYRPALAMMRDVDHYVNPLPGSPKTFVGEWASTDVLPWTIAATDNPTGTFHDALGDAVWLTGMERGAGQVLMQCYAPLLCNVNPGGTQWSLNLIGYDALRSYGSPSYYVQKMFAEYTGVKSTPVTVKDARPVIPAKALPSMVGVGSWHTVAEYKGFKITTPDGNVIEPATDGWTHERGRWSAEGDVLRQTDPRNENGRALAGVGNRDRYTIHLQARKIEGEDGFQVYFNQRGDLMGERWEIGGWHNTHSILTSADGSLIGEQKELVVQPDRWYDIEVRVNGPSVEGYVDGQLMVSGSLADPATLFASASVAANGDLFLKVVNASLEPADVSVDLPGGTFAPSADGLVMSGDWDARNSLQYPRKLTPRPVRIDGIGAHFQHKFPASSATVVRITKRPS